MIKPGLFTASTSNADHFGMSDDSVLLSVFRSLGFGGLRNAGSPRSESWQPTGCPTAHTCAVTKWRTWSEAESCAGGL